MDAITELEVVRTDDPIRRGLRHIPAPVWNRGAKSVPVGIDPTRSELAELRSSDPGGILRVLEPEDPEGKWYFWPSDQALHDDVGAHYGLNPKAYYRGIVE